MRARPRRPFLVPFPSGTSTRLLPQEFILQRLPPYFIPPLPTLCNGCAFLNMAIIARQLKPQEKLVFLNMAVLPPVLRTQSASLCSSAIDHG